ncbi:MIP/aquaporin family protein [Arthrobacter castelli]|uniref:MIP/aquaporin family protein n=1 Tax=Arthrobacter castelli TaxID=271431 RepID=UPI0003F9C783|nr:MIP/aquaporin family protein [Arthrobacter castelli]
MSLWEVFLAESFGTAMLTLLGCGVVANVALAKTKGNNGGFLMVNFGWGLAVFAGVYVASQSGAHINPAVTLGLLLNPDTPMFAEGIEATFANALVYWAAEMVGAVIGAVFMWLAHKKHFDEDLDPAAKLGVFATGPSIRSTPWNLVTEIIATWVLVFVILMFGNAPSGLGPLAVALLVVSIGASLGGPTGYAINPARDLGPRIAHAFLPIKGKGGGDWSYAWIPVVGPLLGGAIAGLMAPLIAFTPAG